MSTNVQRIIVVIGPPNIGKTEFCREITGMFKEKNLTPPPVVSFGNALFENGLSHWTPERHRETWIRTFNQIQKQSLESSANRVILLDLPLTSRESRVVFLREISYRIRMGATVELVMIPSPTFKELTRRNNQRPPDTHVDPEVLQKLYREWAGGTTFPTQAEGWARVWTDLEALKASVKEGVIEPMLAERNESALRDSLKGIELSDADFDRDAR